MRVIDRRTKLVDVLGDAAKKLAKERDLRTVGDFLDFLPRRYIDATTSGHLSEFAMGEQAVLIATVVASTTRRMRQRRGEMLQVRIEDADGAQAELVFFSKYGHEQRLQPGVRGVFRGQLGSYGASVQLTHPDYSLLDAGGEEQIYAGGLVPLYRAIKGVTDMQLTRSYRLVLDQLDGSPDPVPPQILARHDLADQVAAYRAIHLPRTLGEAGRGRRRLRYDEALVVQTVLAQRRAEYDALQATARPPRSGGLLSAFDERLPFDLTAGQREVGEQIAADMARTTPMHRLLQGEVGSGKTIVALRAMLATVDAGAQAALLAPTEVLAQQHHRSITAMLGDLAQGGMLGGAEHGTRVALLTGSMSRAQRASTLQEVLNQEAGIVIGTHALIQDTVMFGELGLVVVDEQHRFGVEQRDALRAKATRSPHVLVMTATPIPRTVAMTVFGDMDTSVLRELPRGRAPIVSHLVPAANPAWLQRTWQRVGEEVAQGHQAYVVCARIGGDEPSPGQGDDSDLGELLDADPSEPVEEGSAPQRPEAIGVHGMLEDLRAEPALAGLRIELLHGRLPADEKEAVMQAFGRGEIDVLVSTTVIEVGVDVPNATAMVVMDADRFGISQLHQLRGRVGRGSAGGLCLLVTSTDNEETVERLTAVAATTDGFALAELDLSLRSEGDILGARQSGHRSGLRLLRLAHPKDVELIDLARADAADLVASDPTLAEHPGLAQLVTTRLDDVQAAFLERG
nr:ATP-dependent DNA helicase RecG [Allobranchiibius sp. CTAmp26]